MNKITILNNHNISLFPSRFKYCRAYSLVEMAIVLIIFGLMFGIIYPAYEHMQDEVKSDNVAEQIKDLEKLINDFFKEKGYYPDSLDEVISPPPLDPWGNPIEYLKIKDAPSQNKGKIRKDKNLVPINSDYDLYSSGPDGESVSPLTANASKDDIVRGRNGDFVGVATEF